MSRYEQQFFEYLDALKRNIQIQPLILGATYGSGGGLGGRAGGFIGSLPQNRVTYDLSELEDSSTPADYSGASLVDNLNHIRYRIATLETGGVPSGITGIDIQEDDVLISSNITIVNFEGGVNVTSNGGGKVTINVTASGGGSITVQDTDVNVATDVTILNFEGDANVINDGGGKVTITVSGTGYTGGNTFLDQVTITEDTMGGAYLQLTAQTNGGSYIEFNEGASTRGYLYFDYLNDTLFLENRTSGNPTVLSTLNSAIEFWDYDAWTPRLKVVMPSGFLSLIEQTSHQSTPDSGWGNLYALDNGKLYYKNDSGTLYDLTTSSSGSGSIAVQENDVEISPTVTTINFEGNASVTDNGSGKVTVTVSGGISGNYLKLDAGSTTTSSIVKTNTETGHSNVAARVKPRKFILITGGNFTPEANANYRFYVAENDGTLLQASDYAAGTSGNEMTFTITNILLNPFGYYRIGIQRETGTGVFPYRIGSLTDNYLESDYGWFEGTGFTNNPVAIKITFTPYAVSVG